MKAEVSLVPDIYSRIAKYMGPLGQYADIAEGYYIFPELEGPAMNRMFFNGKEVICWSINNYLGIAEEEEIKKIDIANVTTYGLSYPMGARLMTGETVQHKELEQELASFVQKEAACLLNYGYQGMISCIDASVSRHDIILYDAESHACILDGVRMHTGKVFSFEHNNVEHLEKRLIRASELATAQTGGILVITEGVFGMRGDQGKLKEITDLKEKYSFRLLVDDAHGFGTLGENGKGTGVEQGVQDKIDIYFSTFAKSIALIGGFVAGEPGVIQYLKYNMRSQMFAKSLPLVFVLSARKRLEMIAEHPERKDQLWYNVHQLQQGLKKAGFDIGITNSPVTPVYMQGTPEEASQLVYDLRENYGIFCSMVLYPMIPKGEIILRLIPTSLHTKKDIEDTLTAFNQVLSKLRSGFYNNTVFNPVLTEKN
jgi:glycine C-acetyltransferase